MIDSPLIRELMAESTQQALHEAIVVVLKERFGPIDEALTARLKTVHKKEEVNEFLRFAVACPSLRAFQDRLPLERPRPTSSRKTPRRRKSSAEQ